MQRIIVWMLVLPLMLTASSPLLSQDDVDEEYLPGLSATYTAGDKTIHRVDDDVAFVWGTSVPDSRLSAGPFRAQWQGRLLVKEPGEYRFYAFVEGRVSMRVDGREVLTGEQRTPGWVTGPPQTLEFGEFPLQVEFKKTQSHARVKLFWSAGHFQREPLPTYLLFRDDSHPAVGQINRGQMLYDSHRCNRCHRRENEPLSPPAPSLEQASSGLSRDWLVGMLSNPATGPHAKMPRFGFNRNEAGAIAAYLLQPKPISLSKLPKIKKTKKKIKDEVKPLRAGEILFRSVGCLACHTHGEHGSTSAYTGGDLTRIGAKRTTRWLYTWLENPKKLNRDHRMPVFKLSPEERLQLALYLSNQGKKPAQSEPEDSANGGQSPEAGRRLITAARCANCHRIPGIEADGKGIPPLSSGAVESKRSCLQKRPDRAHFRPAYPQADRAAIMAFVNSRKGALSPVSRFDQGHRLLAQKNCIACHERDGQKGIVETAGAMAQVDRALLGQSEGLIPPALTAVGDKLVDEALAEAVSGEQKSVRLPWLRVRMPRFTHTTAEKQALLAHLSGHDRIPAETVKTAASPEKSDKTQTLLAGHELVGGKGFSCVACHAFGKFQPLNVALGTRGSDLLMPGRRMRRSYFLRWTRSPLRVVPGMEMPSFDKPVAGILDGHNERQLAAVWDALNDPNFTVPTNPAVVEQYLVVQPNSPARIVRDVFTNHKSDGGYTPRAMAVGFANRHSVLLDLDTFSLRQWWLGDFARQRTQGKSWFWDAAGVTLTAGMPNQTDIVLRAKSDDRTALVFPKREHGVHGRLLRYEPAGDGVRLEYQLNFILDGKAQTVVVEETLLPLNPEASPGHTGWSRQIDLPSVPPEYEALFLNRTPKFAVGEPTVKTDIAWETISMQHGKKRATFRAALLGHKENSGTFYYLCTLKPEILQQNPPIPLKLPIEKITSVPGYDGVRLPLPRSIMPTSICWTSKGKLAFTSLKGHVYIAEDSDGDGLEDRLRLFEEGLASPFGIIADGDDLIVAHKPELLRLRDTDGDGRADVREVVATGWGFNENYHDWACGIVRDASGNLYIGLGSDYAQKKRPSEQTHWRGKVLRIEPSGRIEPVGHDLRYPTGLAIDGQGRIFMSDQQGVQNTFNEVNYLVPGRGYGITSPHRKSPKSPPMWPAVQLPHPWTRSVNGIFFLNPKLVKNPAVFGPFAGQGLGCEFHTHALTRFSMQEVDGVLQGAAYRFGLPHVEDETTGFIGALCGAVGPGGDLYVGSIHDSGWLGGLNLGDIVRLRPNGKLPAGIRELRAFGRGFKLTFTAPVNREAAADPKNYAVSAYTRVWKGGYATPDSGRHKVTVTDVKVSADGRSVELTVDQLKEKYVYEVTCRRIGVDQEKPLWPTTAYYTMTVVPKNP